MLYCKKCKKETPHHYFMMFPVGAMVCNMCGETHEPVKGGSE